jgi:hypothetical protein
LNWAQIACSQGNWGKTSFWQGFDAVICLLKDKKASVTANDMVKRKESPLAV